MHTQHLQLKCIKQILRDVKAETDNAILVEDFNTPLTTMITNHPDRKPVRNVGVKPHSRANDLNRHGTFHPRAAEYTFFSSV